MVNLLTNMQEGGLVLSLAIMLGAGFFMTRITRLFHLPHVSGYILAGVLIGPYMLHLIPDPLIAQMDFITDIALAFIAFGAGHYFRLSALKKQGVQVIIITLMESLMAMLGIVLAMFTIFHLSLPISLLLGAIGCATAPASTIMTIRQYHAKGAFVSMVLQVTALDDAVALCAFTFSTAWIQSLTTGSFTWSQILIPLVGNFFMAILGALLGAALYWFLKKPHCLDHRLALTITALLLQCGICLGLTYSPLLPCMIMGATYINLSGNSEIFHSLNSFTPPINLLFFVLSGLRMNVAALAVIGWVGVGYFFVRILAKMLGAYLGAKFTSASASIRHWLGLALIPQAGVSIGLAVLAQRMLDPASGALISTIILSSALLYEMIGPACARFALIKAHAFQLETSTSSSFFHHLFMLKH